MRRVAQTFGIVACLALVAGCGSTSPQTPSPTAAPTQATNPTAARVSPAPATSVASGPTTAPTPPLDPSLDWGPGADTVVLRVQAFADPGAPGPQHDQEPIFSLYGDGRIVFAPIGGPSITSTALRPLVHGHLSRLGMRSLLALTQASGLLDAEGASYRLAAVTDVATTVFTAVTNAGPRTASVYGLGYPVFPGATDRDLAGSQALAAFVAQLQDPPSVLGPSKITIAGPYEPDVVHVFVGPYPKGAAIPPDAKRWPLGDLASYGGSGRHHGDAWCVVVTGADLATILPLLPEMDDPFTWTSSGHAYHLLVERLLPDQMSEPC